MTLHPLLEQLLLPNRHAVIFAVKGVISMALALFVAMYLQLDRPYWALVSAIFLQVRPQSGLVIEKALCQIGGSIIGGLAGILMLAVLMPYPLLALMCLTLWVGGNSAASTMVHNTNYIYAFAMAGVTAVLVVILVMADAATASSQAVFDIAQARISEITVGALCALLVSQLLWPMSVKDGLRQHARVVINESLQYLILELSANSTHAERHRHSDQVFEALVALNDDSSAVVYEGPEGPGRGRAANLLCQKILSLLAVTQILGRRQRSPAGRLSPAFHELLNLMRQDFDRIAATEHFDEAYAIAQGLRRRLLDHRSGYVHESPIVCRLTNTALGLVADLVMVLRAYSALEKRDQTLLKSTRLENHRDPLIGAINGFRTAVVFLMGVVVWVVTASPAAIMMMIMPVIFSIMFARFPLQALTGQLQRLLVGASLAVPVALWVGLGVLAQSSSDFEMLVLVLAGPYFVGLLALAKRETLPYGMGFCIPFTIITQPSNHMLFEVDTALSMALGLLVGVSVLYWIFKLIAPPDSDLMQRRLLRTTARDLINIDRHEDPETWFNGRMGERLLRLANYDQAKGDGERYMTGLGLTGLNLGHVILRLRSLLQPYAVPDLQSSLARWQQALADAYLAGAAGDFNEAFSNACTDLLQVIDAQAVDEPQRVIVEGMCENLTMTLQRTATAVTEARARYAAR